MGKKVIIIFTMFFAFIIIAVSVDAKGYWVTGVYYFQHNPMTYNAKNNHVQNVYRSKKLKKNKAWNNAFIDRYNSYESKDSSGNNKRSFNLNVVLVNSTNISNADIILDNDKKQKDRLGIAYPCVIKSNGKHSCSKKNGNKENVHYYRIRINKYAHTRLFPNVNTRKKEARITAAHEFGHSLAMGHYTYKNKFVSEQPYSIMSYAGSNVMNHKLKNHDIKRLRNLYGK